MNRSLLVILTLFLSFVALFGFSACGSGDDDKNPVNPVNHAPVITSVTASQYDVVFGDTLTFICVATDSDDDPLTYNWTSTNGTFPDGNHDSLVTWIAPRIEGIDTAKVSVSDGDEFAIGQLYIQVSTDNIAPIAPSNPTPVENAEEVEIPVTLGWNCSDPNGDNLLYDIYLGTTSTPEMLYTDITTSQYEVSELEEATLYYWKIVAKDGNGGETEGPVWSFTTIDNSNHPPEIPTNTGPSDQAVDVEITVDLSWTCTDPEGDNLVYDVYLGSSSELTDENLVSENQTDLIYSPATMSWGVTYYWKVVAKDTFENQTVSPVWSFTITGDIISEQEFELGNTGVMISMIWIEAGTFMMGAQENEIDAFVHEYPRHEVILDHGFWIGKYEVTQEQWTAVTGESDFSFPNSNYPADGISYDDIVNNFLSSINDGTWRLPTEAEWEYSCRAGAEETRFWWGDDDNYETLGDFGWYYTNSDNTTHEVGSKFPNPFGLYDMNGNVSEWVSDWYGGYPFGTVTNPGGPDNGAFRIQRGGSYTESGAFLRSASRYQNGSTGGGTNSGFRLVRVNN